MVLGCRVVAAGDVVVDEPTDDPLAEDPEVAAPPDPVEVEVPVEVELPVEVEVEVEGRAAVVAPGMARLT